jgi:hypothetical protein
MPQDSPDISGMVSDPGFLKLAPNDQREALQKLTGDESFGKLSDEDVGQFISKVSPEKKTSGATGSWLPKYSIDPKNKDFTLPPGLEGKPMLGTPISPAGAAASLPRAAIGIAGGYGAGKVADQFTKNPWIHDAATMVGSLATESIASGAREMANFPARQVARDIANKVAGKSMADWIMPPPPEPPVPPVNMEEVATQRAAQKVAQRAADEKAGLRKPSAEVEAARVAKEHEAAMNKEASEHDAIRKRYEDEKEKAAKAEQTEAAHREKSGKQKLDADAAQQKYYDDLDKATEKVKAAEAKRTELAQQKDRLARVKEGKRTLSADAAQEKFHQSQIDEMDQKIKDNEAEVNKTHADRNRLNDQWAEAMQRRGAQQAQLDSEAKQLQEETQKATAKSTSTKTELGQRLAKLNALREARAEAEAEAGGPASVSPEVWKELSPMAKARIIARYSNTKLRAQEQGTVHAARGSSGAQLSNNAIRTRTGFPPPPTP